MDCVLSDWEPEGECSKPCGGGELSWARLVEVPATNGGEQCEGGLSETRPCNVDPCPGEHNLVVKL